MQEYRKLATVQTIKEIAPITGADNIELVSFESVFWKCVVKKGEFKVGDKAVYLEIDSLVPVREWSRFLDKKSEGKAVRLKSCRLKGALSQGLALPLTGPISKDLPQEAFNILHDGSFFERMQDGYDLTEFLGITKYEPPTPPLTMGGMPKGNFPHFMPKTDELRIQAYPKVLEEFKGKECVACVKMDGTSFSCYYRATSSDGVQLSDGEFGVCSRNLELKESDNLYWNMAKQYNLPQKLKEFGKNIAIQAEICGPSIQANRMDFKDKKMKVFNVWDIDNQTYFDHDAAVAIAIFFGLEFVPVVWRGVFEFNSIQELMEKFKDVRYENGHIAEGVVIRPVVETQSSVLGGRLSIKLINNDYLLKTGE